jgi:hypothetical protein
MNQNSIAIHWNPDENFWSLHPAFKSIKVFKELHDSDKTKKKDKSSQLMWAIAFYVDLHEDNPWRNLPDEEKMYLIAEDYLNDSKFSFEDSDIVPLLEEYEKRVLTIAQKELRRLEKKISQRGDFLEKTKYTMDSYDDKGRVIKGTADQLDKMLVATGKIYDQLSDIKAKLDKEEASGGLKGGATESAGEQGII